MEGIVEEVSLFRIPYNNKEYGGVADVAATDDDDGSNHGPIIYFLSTLPLTTVLCVPLSPLSPVADHPPYLRRRLGWYGDDYLEEDQ